MFLDETGFMLQPVRRRTWAPSGQTPIQRTSARHYRRVSVIGAISLSPKRQHLGFFFQAMQTTVKKEDIIEFLTELHRHLRRKVILVWDRLNPHRSAAKWFEKHHPNWFRFEWLPPYAPELNPLEQCWSHTKYSELANYCPLDVDELAGNVNKVLKGRKNKQQLMRSWFAHAKLKLP